MKVKFVSQPFLTNRSVLSIKNGFLQNQKIHFPAKLCEIPKNVRLKLFISKKLLLKIKSCSFQPNHARYDKILKSKIVHLKEIYNFDFDHFLIKRTVFVLIVKNVIKKQKFNFPDKLCDIRNKC